MTGLKIIDEFTDLNISRQQKYALRHIKLTLCIKCSKKATDNKFCKKHHEKQLYQQKMAHYPTSLRKRLEQNEPCRKQEEVAANFDIIAEAKDWFNKHSLQ